jgi:methylated-DNA-[protein]-cysteine S-methyltransferase
VPLNFRTVSTRLGHIAFIMDDRGLRRVYLPEAGGAPALRARVRQEFPTATERRDLGPRLASQLQAYFEGEPVDFDVQLNLDAECATDFRRAVWNACHRIPYGQTVTYGGLARRAGRPGAARAVGTAMRCNPCPIVIPCHRVLGCNNAIGGYSGPGGVEFKRQLLQMESAVSIVL